MIGVLSGVSVFLIMRIILVEVVVSCCVMHVQERFKMKNKTESQVLILSREGMDLLGGEEFFLQMLKEVLE